MQKNASPMPFLKDLKGKNKKGSSRYLIGVNKPDPKSVPNDKLFDLMSSYLSTDIKDIEQFIANHVEYTLAITRNNFDKLAAFKATALSLRDRMIEFWNDTQTYFDDKGAKRVYYLSIEFLMGRSMQNAVINLGLKDEYSTALKNLGMNLEALYEEERDAALGNGGLGRLAACFLDSMATLNYPAWGYGIRYKYGMFKQGIRDGYQSETPDYWLLRGNPWEIARGDISYKVHFGGRVNESMGEKGRINFQWEPESTVIAVAYDNPIPGYDTTNTINLRLWDSRPNSEFDLQSFNAGDYERSLRDQQRSATITNVLYPDDSTAEGKELRLQQQYFFVSATLQDIMARFKKTKKPLSEFPTLSAIQLNDTHPTIAIPELMRLLLDFENASWEEAWDITTRTFGYTNHTVLPEALERWSIGVFSRNLPRHIGIIMEINRRLLIEVNKKWPNDGQRMSRMSIIDDFNQVIRMANLAIVGSHSINGVAELHSNILKDKLFTDFYEMWPNKFNNKTNGVTPRRWVLEANPDLSNLISEKLGNTDWITDMSKVVKLRDFADDPDTQAAFADVKLKNKMRLRDRILKELKVEVDPHALFDIHVKRIHEYKRQLLNILGVIYRYIYILKASPEEKKKIIPRVVIFAGKAAPAYRIAKLIIKLVNSVAKVVNSDEKVGNLLKVVFLPDYNVSLAEVICPASDISQHISTAGTEASGTSNMKFAMNSGLIFGTWDGANIEMAQEIGPEHLFIFGFKTEEIEQKRSSDEPIDPRLYEVLKLIESGKFEGPDNFRDLINPLWLGKDHYLVAKEFPGYLEAQKTIDDTWLNQAAWRKKMIMTTAGMGKFSSDRTIDEYAKDIWGLKALKIPDQETPGLNPPLAREHPTKT